jgi:glutathione S-transferase
MEIKRHSTAIHLLPETVSDIERILVLWKKALTQNKGPFLFGDFGIVDAFYAPVVMRFVSYDIEIRDAKLRAYMKRVQKHSTVLAWVSRAKKEKPFYKKF